MQFEKELERHNYGSKDWAKAAKKAAFDLARGVTIQYVSLAKLLHTLDSARIDNDENNPYVYTLWGFSSLYDFAESELQLERRRFSYIKSIGYVLCEVLKDCDPNLIERFVNLGWTKVREIGSVVEASQLEEWVIKGEQSTFRELEEMVKKYRSDKKRMEIERDAATGMPQLAKDPFGPPVSFGTVDASQEGFQIEGVSFSANIAAAPASTPITPALPKVPDIEKITHEHFAFFDDQCDVVRAAIARAKQISESDKKSHNLALICTSFLATNDFNQGDADQKMKLLAMFEKSLGCKLVAADPDTNEVIYGLKSLEDIASAAISEDEEMESSDTEDTREVSNVSYN